MSIKPKPVQTKVHFKILQSLVEMLTSCYTHGLDGIGLLPVFKKFLETEKTVVYTLLLESAYSRLRTYVLRYVKV